MDMNIFAIWKYDVITHFSDYEIQFAYLCINRKQ